MNENTCDAGCQAYETSCTLELDKVNYVPGDTMTITITGSNSSPVAVLCGAQSCLKREDDEIVWNSFDEDLYATIPAGAVDETFTIELTVPQSWAGTDTSSGSDYGMDTVRDDNTVWAKGDNFNVQPKMSHRAVRNVRRIMDNSRELF